MGDMSTIKSRRTTSDTGVSPEKHREEDAPPYADVFEVLSNPRRRQIVHYLLQRPEETVTLRELSRQIAAWENDVDPAAVNTDQRKRVYTALRQSHLPVLAERDFIRYDDDRSIVRATDRVSELRVYLEIVPGNEIPWSVYYVGLGVLGVSLVLAKVVGVFPIDAVPSLGWAAVIALLVTVSGLVHVYQHQQLRIGGAGPPL